MCPPLRRRMRLTPRETQSCSHIQPPNQLHATRVSVHQQTVIIAIHLLHTATAVQLHELCPRHQASEARHQLRRLDIPTRVTTMASLSLTRSRNRMQTGSTRKVRAALESRSEKLRQMRRSSPWLASDNCRNHDIRRSENENLSLAPCRCSRRGILPADLLVSHTIAPCHRSITPMTPCSRLCRLLMMPRRQCRA